MCDLMQNDNDFDDFDDDYNARRGTEAAESFDY
jgi:hypothetical protein